MNTLWLLFIWYILEACFRIMQVAPRECFFVIEKGGPNIYIWANESQHECLNTHKRNGKTLCFPLARKSIILNLYIKGVSRKNYVHFLHYKIFFTFMRLPVYHTKYRCSDLWKGCLKMCVFKKITEINSWNGIAVKEKGVWLTEMELLFSAVQNCEPGGYWTWRSRG